MRAVQLLVRHPSEWNNPRRNAPGCSSTLAHCHGYSDSASDYAMLAIVGRPTAVNPDMRLRSLARAYNWPILDLK